MTDFADLAQRLEAIAEELADAAMDVLREAIERGEKKPARERQLTAARRAVEKAARLVEGSPVADGDDGPEKVAVIGDTPDGARCVAVATDPELAARGIIDDLIGLPVVVRGTEFSPAA